MPKLLRSKVWDRLLADLAEAQQKAARAEGKVESLERAVTLLDAAKRLNAATEEIGQLKAKVDELYVEQRECLVRATAPAAVVPALFGNGQR